MPNSFVVNSTPLGLKVVFPQIVSVSVTIGSTYTSASGGFNIDFATVLAQLDNANFPAMTAGQRGQTYTPGVDYSRCVDVLASQVITGGTNPKIGQPLVWTRTTTASQFTVRLYSALDNTEISNGAETLPVIKVFLLIT